jgi:hypothetical protein
MDPLVIGIIVVAAAVIGWLLWQQQRTQKLRSQYSTEYDRAVGELGRRRGEAELLHRQERVRQLDIRPLGSTERDRFSADWRRVQEQFVDDPEGAVARGDQLVDEVMRARGSASTEELRQAMVDYRELFEDLLTTPATTDTRREREVIKSVERADEVEAVRARPRSTDIDREVRP